MILGILCFTGGLFFGIMIAPLCAVASIADDEMDKMQK